MSLKKTTREKLLQAVKLAAPQLAENVVFLAGARKIKNDQMEIEFVQNRALAGRKASMLALFNEGDDRFNSGRTTMRVWLMVNLAGCISLLGHTGIDFNKLAEEVKTLSDDEIIAVLAQVKTVMVAGVQQPVKIVCKETVLTDNLPKSIREIVTDENAPEEYKNRYILQNGKDDLIVDEFGNKIYRHFELTYGDVEDELVTGKMLQSDYAKKLANTSEEKSTENVLKGVLEK